MFLRFSLIFVFVLSFEFGALKSIANIANSDVSDNGLGNIKNIMKYSGINSTNFTSNHQIHLAEEEMFLRLINAALLFASNQSSIHISGGLVETINQENHFTFYLNPIINNYLPSVSQPLEKHNTETISPSTSRVQLQPEVDDGSSKAFHRSKNVQGLPGVQPTI